MGRQLPTLSLCWSQARESSGSAVKLWALSEMFFSTKCLNCVGKRRTKGAPHCLSWWPVSPPPASGPGPPWLSEASACASWLQFIQWDIHRSGLKVSEDSLPADATGPFVLSGYSGYKQVQVPRGRLFAFDSEGNYMLTCSATGGVIYKVPGGGGGACPGGQRGSSLEVWARVKLAACAEASDPGGDGACGLVAAGRTGGPIPSSGVETGWTCSSFSLLVHLLSFDKILALFCFCSLGIISIRENVKKQKRWEMCWFGGNALHADKCFRGLLQ